MRQQVMADYLKDPRSALWQKMIEEGSSSSPVGHWTQGANRLLQAGLGGYMAKKLRGEYEEKEKEAMAERQQALAGLTSFDPETRIRVAQSIKSPYNQDLSESLLKGVFDPLKQGTQPAALQLANEYLKAKAEGDLNRANAIASFAKTVDKNVEETDYGYAPLPGLSSALGEIERGRETGKQQARIEYEPTRAGMVEQAKLGEQLKTEPSIEKQKTLAKEEAQIQIAQPKTALSLKGSFDQTKNIESKIDEAISLAGPTTTGWGASLANIPETDAKALSGILSTIAADSAFSSLQSMRDASPTGGALGQVSERELTLLKDAKASLDQSADTQTLKKRLSEYKLIRRQALKNVADAYQQTYGTLPKGVDMSIFENQNSKSGALNIPPAEGIKIDGSSSGITFLGFD